MERKYIVRKFFAGLFFTMCIVMISGVVFILGIEKGFTEPKFPMTILFRRVGGLNGGSPVRLSGVNIGTVDNIDFLEKEIEGRGVQVRLSIFEKYRNQVRKSQSIAIITEGILGEKMIEITTSSTAKVPDLKRPIIGQDPLDVQVLAETFGDAAGSLLETSHAIDMIIEEMKSISGTTKRLLNRIEQRVIDGNLFKVF